MTVYRSPFEAYPFLCEDSEDFRCDFEILTDEMASQVGLLRSRIDDPILKDELLWICELLYHLNPSLRKPLKITEDEEERLISSLEHLKKSYTPADFTFVIPQGGENACLSHLLRVNSKKAIRLVYRHLYKGNEVNPRILDILNILSNYFFYLALKLNSDEQIEEIEFISRNY